MEPGGALAAVGVLLLLALLVALSLLSRQRALSRRVGSFACMLGHEGAPLRGRREAQADGVTAHPRWIAGYAQYGAGRLDWWRTVSLVPRPGRTWGRTELVLLEREQLDDVDASGNPLLLVHCRQGDETFLLRMSAPAYEGLVSWLESAPRVVRPVL